METLKKSLYELNEHTDKETISELTQLCSTEDVCLVSDCGTPSFFDPGFQLVFECRKENVIIQSLPGVSSLTALMPYLSKKTERFNVIGFPPRETEERIRFFNSLKKENTPFFIMDTPYRLKKTMENLNTVLPKATCVLGLSLTCENELVLEGEPQLILKEISNIKKENFVCMVYP